MFVTKVQMLQKQNTFSLLLLKCFIAIFVSLNVFFNTGTCFRLVNVRFSRSVSIHQLFITDLQYKQ